MHSSWQNCRLACTRFSSSARKFSVGLKSGLCDTLILLSLCLFAITLVVCLGSSISKTDLRPSFNFDCCLEVILQYIHLPSSWCDLLCEVHQSHLQHSTTTTWCCHPCASWSGWCSLACKPNLFSSKHDNGHYSQTDPFFIRPEDNSPESQSVAFLWWFWMRFILANYCFTDDSGAFRHLIIAPKDEPDLWSSTIFSPRFMAVFFWFSQNVKQRAAEFEGGP